jgi:protein SCO1/2
MALILLGVFSILIGIWLGQLFFGGGEELDPVTGGLKEATLLPEPRPLDDFSLTTEDNGILDRESLQGHWTFVAFGYTYCPDVCPTLMATFDTLEKQLGKSSGAHHPEFLFVSVDPERDTPERIGQYTRYFNPRIRGATAGHEVLHHLTDQLGVLYQRSEAKETSMDYLVDHSASILLLDPQVRLAAIFGLPHDPQAMAEDFRAISAQSESKP